MINSNRETSKIGRLEDLERILYPYVEPGSKSVLPFFQQAFSMIDEMDGEMLGQNQKEQQNIVENIKIWLNKVCKDYHREELVNAVLQKSYDFKNHLKGIPVAIEFFPISNWPQFIKSQSITHFIPTIKQPLKTEALIFLDQQYFQHRKVTNLSRFLISRPKLFIFNHSLQNNLLFEQNFASLAPSHIYFIGIIAASTFGSRYLWNLMVDNFIRQQGDVSWLKEGIESDKVPRYLKNISKISCQMATNPQKLLTCEKLKNFGEFQITAPQILKSLVALSYYQMLSCLCIGLGLIPESINNEEFLPEHKFIKPSIESFEIMMKLQEDHEIQEKIIGEECTTLNNSWVIGNEEIKKFREEDFQSDSEDSQEQIATKKITQETNLLTFLEDDEYLTKINKLRTIQNLRMTYGKFTYFCEASPVEEPEKHNEDKKIVFRQEDYLFASGWGFSTHVLPLLEIGLNAPFANIIKQYLGSLRSLQKQKGNDIQAYYESLHNYMHEHVDYVTLMNSRLSASQKNMIKLVTESPFLLNNESITILDQGLKGNNIQKYLLQICSYKLQFNISLLALLYDRHAFEK